MRPDAYFYADEDFRAIAIEVEDSSAVMDAEETRYLIGRLEEALSLFEEDGD